MNVTGSNLERAEPLVNRLREMECDSHDELAEVHVIAGQDGTVQMAPRILCCDKFREAVVRTIEAHNAERRHRPASRP